MEVQVEVWVRGPAPVGGHAGEHRGDVGVAGLRPEAHYPGLERRVAVDETRGRMGG